jgi:hypothetical protein
MLEELPDSLDLVLFVDVSGEEEETLRNGNRTSVCISCNSTAERGGVPGCSELGFQSVDDFRLVSSKRADLVFFGSASEEYDSYYTSKWSMDLCWGLEDTQRGLRPVHRRWTWPASPPPNRWECLPKPLKVPEVDHISHIRTDNRLLPCVGCHMPRN